MERRTLYNLLRMNWLRDNQENVEPWQVEDYRSLSLKQLFERLSERQIHLDQERFFEAAQSFDSPEDLVDAIGQSLNVAGKELDAVYLLIFELWRRLLPEKQSLSLLCDELDNLIHAYDQGNLFHLEKLQDALANLVVVIEDNAEEEEEEPATLFIAVMQNLANDLVAFLYDMITDQIDLGEVDYAEELYEMFNPFVQDNKWFLFLEIRLKMLSDPEQAEKQLAKLIKQILSEDDSDFNFEILSWLSRDNQPQLFQDLLAATLPLIKMEADFQEIIGICHDYLSFQDNEEGEQAIERLLETRPTQVSENEFSTTDPARKQLLAIIANS